MRIDTICLFAPSIVASNISSLKRFAFGVRIAGEELMVIGLEWEGSGSSSGVVLADFLSILFSGLAGAFVGALDIFAGVLVALRTGKVDSVVDLGLFLAAGFGLGIGLSVGSGGGLGIAFTVGRV
jgi:hypothetical protein